MGIDMCLRLLKTKIETKTKKFKTRSQFAIYVQKGLQGGKKNAYGLGLVLITLGEHIFLKY